MKNHEITLPLLNEVIESGIESFDIRDNTIYYTSRSFLSTKEMNLDTFCFRCKEWAFRQEIHWEIESRWIANNTGGYDALPLGYACVLFDDMPYIELKAPTEQQAIIKATLWILENK